MTSRTDGYGGGFATRCLDVFVSGKKVHRIWVGPTPARTGVTGVSVALCKGEMADYVVIYDENAFWLVNLLKSDEILTTFPEKVPPTILAEYAISDFGNVVPMAKNFSFWVQRINRKRSLLEE